MTTKGNGPKTAEPQELVPMPQPGTEDWITFTLGTLRASVGTLWNRVQHGHFRDPEEARAAVKAHELAEKAMTITTNQLTQLPLPGLGPEG